MLTRSPGSNPGFSARPSSFKSYWVFNSQAKNSERGDGIRYSERDTSLLSKREILAGAFDSVAKTDRERDILHDYKYLINILNRLEAQAAELRVANTQERARKADADKALIASRATEIKDIENMIARADKKLLRMQNAAPLRNPFKRESARISALAKEDAKNKLARWRQKRDGSDERTRLIGNITKNTMVMHKKYYGDAEVDF